jgi:hypothetical protein
MPIQTNHVFRGQIPMPQAYMVITSLNYSRSTNEWTPTFGVYANAETAKPIIEKQPVPDHMKAGKRAAEIAQMEEEMPDLVKLNDPLETIMGVPFKHAAGIDPFAKAEDLMIGRLGENPETVGATKIA